MSTAEHILWLVILTLIVLLLIVGFVREVLMIRVARRRMRLLKRAERTLSQAEADRLRLMAYGDEARWRRIASR